MSTEELPADFVATELVSTNWEKKSEHIEWEYDAQGREIRETRTITYVED